MPSERDIIDLSDVVSGKKTGRHTRGDITTFKTASLAVEDIALARKIYDLARSRGAGSYVHLRISVISGVDATD